MLQYSVAIPAHNAARTIGETIASLLAQTIPPQQVVVVDDGSTDDTASVVQSQFPAVELIRQPNQGVGAATTRAVAACHAPVLAMVDADDIWLPSKMEEQLKILATAPERTIAICQQRLFRHGSTDQISGPVRGGAIRSALVMQRQVFDLVGAIIDPPGGRGDMVDWLARARELGCIFHEVSEPLVLRRIIEGSLSYGRQDERDRGYLYVAFRAMQRRQEAKQP